MKELSRALAAQRLWVRVRNDRLLLTGADVPPAMGVAVKVKGRWLHVVAYWPKAESLEPWRSTFLDDLNERLPTGRWSLSEGGIGVVYRTHQPLPAKSGCLDDEEAAARFIRGHVELVGEGARIIQRWIDDGAAPATRAADKALAHRQPNCERLGPSEQVPEETWATVLESFGLDA